MVCVLKFMRIDVLAEALLLSCCCCCVPYIVVLLVQLPLLLLAVVATGVLVVGGQVAGSTGGPVQQRAPRRTVPVEVRAHLFPHVTRFNHSVPTPSPLPLPVARQVKTI
jgi:hypothetical protein